MLWEGFEQIVPELLDFLRVSGAGGAADDDESDFEEERGLLGAMEEAAQEELLLKSAGAGSASQRRRRGSKAARARARSRSRAMSLGGASRLSAGGNSVTSGLGSPGVGSSEFDEGAAHGGNDDDDAESESDEDVALGNLTALAAAASIGAGPGSSTLASDVLNTRIRRASTVANRTTDNLLSHMKRRGSRRAPGHSEVRDEGFDAGDGNTRARSRSRFDMMTQDALADTDDERDVEETAQGISGGDSVEAYPETNEDAAVRAAEDAAVVGGAEELEREDDTKALADDLAFVQKRMKRDARKERARRKRALAAVRKVKAESAGDEEKASDGRGTNDSSQEALKDATSGAHHSGDADGNVLRNEYQEKFE